MAGMAMGKMTVLAASPLRLMELKAVTPRMTAAMMVMTYDSKRSAAMPAQSPTLSPTLSAMVAALRGSSSGMPASTLPTRSAPTSAALVKMPPPTRMKRASSEAPKAKPMSTAVAVFWKMKHDDGGAEQAEADAEQAGDGAGPVGHLEGGGHLAPHGRRRRCGRCPARPGSCR